MSVLVTGAASGLGKYIMEMLGADGWVRGAEMPGRYYGTVIHCAHDHKEPGNNIDMLERLLSVPCGRLVYISSVEVHKAYSLDNLSYGLTKLRCEQFVRSAFPSHLIVRPCALLGPGMRPNSLTRMVDGEKLTVKGESTFGYIRYESLMPSILNAAGTVTISGHPLPLKVIADHLGVNPEFGGYLYETPPILATHDTMSEIHNFLTYDRKTS